MIKEKIKPILKGWVKITQNDKVIYNGPNTITSDAYTIILKSISEQGPYGIDHVTFLDTGTFISIQPVASVSYPTAQSVTYTGLFTTLTGSTGEISGFRLDNLDSASSFSTVDLTGLGPGGGNIGYDPANQLMIELTIELTII